ncbi:MAG: 2-C-methyl-D-erythritol 2,4-cyclodiphosphate synthase [Acutalibacteraceae bacterium]
MKIGQGYDVHKLVPGRKLIIGGVEIPFDLGLEGHSDADVLLHAVSDSLLGAAGLGDIGKHFPDKDPAYKDADSLELLKTVINMLSNEGYSVVNIDATVIAQKPKLAPYSDEMTNNIAQACLTGKESVNIKATTQEGLGFAGRMEGIAAMAVCLISKN